MQGIVRRHFLDILLAVLVFFLLLYILFWNGTAGLSDNGDYKRIMEMNYIRYDNPSDEEPFVFNNTYIMEFDDVDSWNNFSNILLYIRAVEYYPSFQHVFIKAAMLVNYFTNVITKSDIHIFRIEVLGIIYSLLYAFALLTLFSTIRIPNRWVELLCKVVIIAVVCDVGYVTYFNSFYGEAVQNIFFIFTVAFGLRLLLKTKAKKSDLFFFYLSILIYAWSKFANIPFAMICVLLSSIGLFFYLGRNTRIIIVILGSISIAIILYVYTIIPKWIDSGTTYNSVFFGVLRDADAEQSDKYLKELGLPGYMKELSDSNYYMARVEKTTATKRFEKDFSKVSKFSIGVFYIEHPELLYKNLQITAYNSGIIRPVYLSNYGHDKPRLTFCKKFGFWGELRKILPYNTIWWNFVIWVSFLICLIMSGRKMKRDGLIPGSVLINCFAFMIFAGAVIDFCVPVITNGEADLAKHMLAYIQIADFMSLVVFISALCETAAYIKEKRTECGEIHKPVAAGLAVFLLLYAGTLQAVKVQNNTNRINKSYKELEIGSYIQYGTYNNNKILWQVVRSDGDGFTLLPENTIGAQKFSDRRGTDNTINEMDKAKREHGNNLWTESKVRKWLNTEFINAFSESEKVHLKNSYNRYLLSINNIYLPKRGGNNEFIWTHIPEIADRGYNRAYYAICCDDVFLPGVDLVSQAKKEGLKIEREKPYWLQTPYFKNDSMECIVDTDGYIYIQDADTPDIGVLPAIKIDRNVKFEGAGNLRNPFTIIDKD